MATNYAVLTQWTFIEFLFLSPQGNVDSFRQLQFLEALTNMVSISCGYESELLSRQYGYYWMYNIWFYRALEKSMSDSLFV